jgi:hypothetical protein
MRPHGGSDRTGANERSFGVTELSYSQAPGNNLDPITRGAAAETAGAINSSVRVRQVCEYCAKKLPLRRRGAPGPGRRFCSPCCQKASVREKACFEVAGYNSSRCPRIDAKSQTNSNGCKAKIGHPYPARLSVPLDILGRGHRWPGAPRIDRATRENIAWREIGRARL